jgi:hypothetical protein
VHRAGNVLIAKKRFTETQKIGFLPEAEAGLPV